MGNVVYEINKGINKPIEFRGLKAQYIAYLSAGLVGLLILFAVCHIAGVPVYVNLGAVIVIGYVLMTKIASYSKTYGQYGLMKQAAFRRVPAAVTCRTRRTFTSLSLTGKRQTAG